MLSRSRRGQRPPQQRLSVVFHALGDPTRRDLLARLARKPAMITELAKPFRMSFPAVSRHIRVLEHAGLITRTVRGRAHHCALNAAPLGNAEAWLNGYRRFWEANLEQLARYVESTDERAGRT